MAIPLAVLVLPVSPLFVTESAVLSGLVEWAFGHHLHPQCSWAWLTFTP